MTSNPARTAEIVAASARPDVSRVRSPRAPAASAGAADALDGTSATTSTSVVFHVFDAELRRARVRAEIPNEHIRADVGRRVR